MTTFIQDLRYGLRNLAKNSGFAAVAVLTLALGIGANSAIFTVVNAVLLQPLPYRDPDRLMRLSERSPNFTIMSVAYLNYRDWKDENCSFQNMAAFRRENYDVTGGGEPEHLASKMVSAEFFKVLGISPAQGRDFDPAEGRLGTTPVVLISGGLWKRRFGSNPKAIGTSITLSGQDFTIIGVIPAEFELEGKADVYSLLEQWNINDVKSREMHPGIYVVARLKPGVTRAQARLDMDRIAARLAEAYPRANSKHGINVTPLTEVIVGDVRPTLLVLLGAVGFVLLITCANVANLLLARSTTRHRELAIRSAVGAAGGRVVRQLLTETLLLALLGGAAGLAIAVWGTQAVIAAAPGVLPRMENITVDGWVLAFTLAISLLTGLVFGLVPALQVRAAELHDTLKEGSRGSTAGHHRLQTLLVVSEVAAALVLLVGAGLMLRTIRQLRGVSPGFDPRRVLTFSVGLPQASTASPDRIRMTYKQTVDQIESLPWVKGAAVSTLIPMAGSNESIPYYVNGRPRPASQDDMSWALFYCTGPDYLRTLGIPLLRGRFFTARDKNDSARVAVIDEVMARSTFPNQDPLGKSIIIADFSGDLGPGIGTPMEIVGVVGHVKHRGLDSDATAKIRSQVYVPFVQIPDPFMKDFTSAALVVRTDADPLGMLAAVRRAVLESGNDQPVYGVQTMEQLISASIAGRRFSTLLMGTFAALAMLLAVVGIYGVISYTIAQRTHEIGIRMALGAKPGDVLSVVVKRGMLPVLAGIVIGTVAAFGLTRLMASLLYGVTTSDPVTFAGVILVLACVALTASYIPARRATRVDPMVALRYE